MQSVPIPLEWSNLKILIDAGSLIYRYFDMGDSYLIYAVDNPFVFKCLMIKSGADYDQFEASYKAAASTTVSQFDTDGATLVRLKAAKRGWTFAAIPMEFSTSALQSSSLNYFKLVNGTTRAGISIKIYDAQDAEITTEGDAGVNLQNACKTIVDFEPTYDYELIGGTLRTATELEVDARLWIIAVPDIPAAYGGSKEMCGGINLKYLSPGNVFTVDGRVSKLLTYSAVNHTNKLRFIFKYPAGTTETFQINIELYKP